MAAWFVGGLGTLLAGWLGYRELGTSITDVAIWVGISNAVALVGGLLTLQLEKISWIKETLLAGTFRTWVFIVCFYFGFLLILIPELREVRALAWMTPPLLMSTGLMINPLFGPIQDQIVRNAQRRTRLKTLAAKRQAML